MGVSPLDCQQWAKEHAEELGSAKKVYAWEGKPPPSLPPGVRARAYMTDHYAERPSPEFLQWMADNAPPVEPTARDIMFDGVPLAVTHIDFRIFADYSGIPGPLHAENEMRVYGTCRLEGQDREMFFFASGMDVTWETDGPQISLLPPIAYLREDGDGGEQAEDGRDRGSFVRRDQRGGDGGGAE
jgi:hypothetical protein